MTTQTEPLTWQNLWDAMEANPAEWIPTTEKMYWDMLEVLPPRAHMMGAFLVGEANHSNGAGESYYACFNESFGKYSAKYMTLKEFLQYFAHYKNQAHHFFNHG